MKNIFAFILFMFITGCVSSSVDPFFNFDKSCNRFYDENKRWPISEHELKECELKYQDKTDWNTISELSIKKISEDQIHITYSIRRWYGKDTVSGSVYRPTITIKSEENKSDNE